MVGIPEKERNSVVAIFGEHSTAESAFKELRKAGFDIKNLSIIGQYVGANALRAGLSGLDVSEDRLVKLEASIEAGKSLVIAHGTDDEARDAFALLENSGAEDVRFHRPPGETTQRIA
jgi:hypothetical protein